MNAPELHIKLKSELPEDVIEIHDHRGDETVVIKREALLSIAKYLKDNSAYDMNVFMRGGKVLWNLNEHSR